MINIIPILNVFLFNLNNRLAVRAPVHVHNGAHVALERRVVVAVPVHVPQQDLTEKVH